MYALKRAGVDELQLPGVEALAGESLLRAAAIDLDYLLSLTEGE